MEYKDLPEIYHKEPRNQNINKYIPIFSFPQIVDALLGNMNRNAAINLKDNHDEIILSVDVEGFDPRDLDVMVHGNSVIVKGDSRQEEIQDRPGYYFAMQSSNTFYRTIPLPAQIKPEKTITSFNDGNLEIRMLKGKTTVRSFKPIVEPKE